MNNYTQSKNPHSRAIFVLFLAVFVDLLEFGIIVPLLPFWALNLGATPFVYGIIASAYSFMSFAFAPVWGKISDNKGRRPVILAGLVGTIIGLSLLTLTALIFTTSLLMLFLSRIIGGIFTAATLPTSQAYIADTTKGKDRAKGFGLLGAAFGLGFALGPAIGGVLSIFGGYALPALFATSLAVINILAAIKFLPESLTKEIREQRIEKSKFTGRNNGIYDSIITNPAIILSILLFAIISFVFSNMQSTLALLGKVRFELNESLSGVLFFVVGTIVVITQAGLIRPLSNRFANITLIISGIVLLTISFAGLSTVGSFPAMVLWIIPLALGSSIANPALASLLSNEAPKENSGAILGLNQGVGSFMRVAGPLIGTGLFEISAGYPYLLGSAILMISLVVAIILRVLVLGKRVITPCLRCGNQLQEGVAICGRCGLNQLNEIVTIDKTPN